MALSRIARDSSTQISLGVGVVPLKVSGAWVARPVTAAVTLTVSNFPSGGTASTKYFIYVYDNAGTTTLEASTTAHATDTAYGVEVKSGDATRTLVGMVYLNASTQVANTAAQRFIISWFDRRALEGQGKLSTDRTTTSNSGTNELNTEIRVEFITWAEEAVTAILAGSGYNDTAAQYIAASIAFDGTTENARIAASAAGAGGYESDFTTSVSKSGLSEGYHYVTMLAFVSANTGLYRGGSARTTLSVLLRG